MYRGNITVGSKSAVTLGSMVRTTLVKKVSKQGVMKCSVINLYTLENLQPRDLKIVFVGETLEFRRPIYSSHNAHIPCQALFWGHGILKRW